MSHAAIVRLPSVAKLMDKRPIKILLVEDNAGDARLLREMLNEPASRKHDLTHHVSMEKAVTYLAANPVDVVLLDLGLPDAQGLEAARRIRTAAPHVPLVVLTGLDDEALATQVLQEGAQDYLVKGQIEAHGLLRAMRYAVERKRSELAIIRERDTAQRYLDVAGVMILVLNADATVRLSSETDLPQPLIIAVLECQTVRPNPNGSIKGGGGTIPKSRIGKNFLELTNRCRWSHKRPARRSWRQRL